MEGFELPDICSPPPGSRSLGLARRLQRVESPDTTFFSEEFPVFWERALGCNVWDADGNRYLDLTSAFGVAAIGHAHSAISAAIESQSRRLIHGMGDVHPHELKVRLAEKLTSLAPAHPQGWKVVFGLTGSDAVEIALKTASIATGKPGIIAFQGGYHGVSLGNLSVTVWDAFKKDLKGSYAERAAIFPYPSGENTTYDSILNSIRARVASDPSFGAVLIEPIQGRGGIAIPPAGFLKSLRQLCDECKLLLIVDEVLTGFGRTGEWFASKSERIIPDLIAAGKALGGGMPISVCLGKSEIMDAWGKNSGMARHTSTFLGHPLSCAAALATIETIERENLLDKSRERGDRLREALADAIGNDPRVAEIRGRGMMIGIEFTLPGLCTPDSALAWKITVEGLTRGLILLPSGPHGNVLSITPPLTLTDELMEGAIRILRALM